MEQARPRVVIIGAGFAGLWAAKRLAASRVDITVVDRNNYHSFFPLLYQVAAAELEPGDIAYPVRTILRRQENAQFRLATVNEVDLHQRLVHTTTGSIEYDKLIIAVGSVTSHFGVDGAAEHSFPLRTVDEAVALRNHVLERFEAAELAREAERRRQLTFAIVGGGPTGVEYAGALQELFRGPVAKDHPSIEDPRIVLVEAADSLLTIYPDRLAAYALKRLRRIGVEVRLNTVVEAVDTSGLTLADGTRVDAATVVWTAGVRGDPVASAWGLPTERAHRVPVLPTLQVRGHPDVFVVGDLALPDGAAPMVAQNAIQQGELAAKNIARSIAGEELEPYEYKDLGNMAVIGRNAAVVHLHSRWRFKGYIAWVMWLGVHLWKLIGFRNRLAAVFSWTGDYLFGDRAARLIIGKQRSDRRDEGN